MGDSATRKECNTKKVKHEKSATQKSSMKIVQQGKRTAGKECNMKKMRHEKSAIRKKCNMKRMQHEESSHGKSSTRNK